MTTVRWRVSYGYWLFLIVGIVLCAPCAHARVFVEPTETVTAERHIIGGGQYLAYPISPFATLTGARAVNDPSAVNVSQIVISGTRRATPAGALSMPAFGPTLSNSEIAAVGQLRHRALWRQALVCDGTRDRRPAPPIRAAVIVQV